MAKPRWTTILGSVLAGAGTAVFVVSFLQPWRTCPGQSDSSTGCPMLEGDADIMLFGAIVVLIGVGVVIGGMLFPHARR
jgi:hypothetical protein